MSVCVCVCVYVCIFSHRLLLYRCLEEFTEEKGFELEDGGEVSLGPALGALRRQSHLPLDLQCPLSEQLVEWVMNEWPILEGTWNAV